MRTGCSKGRLLPLLLLVAIFSYGGIMWFISRDPVTFRVSQFPLAAENRQFREKMDDFLEFTRDTTLFSNVTLHSHCNYLSEREQLIDTTCKALWLSKLSHWKITGISRMWGFENTHWGAITLELNHQLKAIFKPCSTRDEDITMEIIGSHIDFILDLGQFPPAVSRKVKLSEIEKYVSSEEEKAIFRKTKRLCGDGTNLHGVIIGWRESLRMIKTPKKVESNVLELYQQRILFSSSLYEAQMISRFHSFYWLVGILKWGKDEFITPQGDLVVLDLDRSNFKREVHPRSSALNFTWCFTCYMDKKLYHNLHAISLYNENPLSSLLELLIHDDPVFYHNTPYYIGNMLNQRVLLLLECINDCIAIYGEKNVLLDANAPSPDSLLTFFHNKVW